MTLSLRQLPRFLLRIALLQSAALLTSAQAAATKPIVFQPAYAPGPADNPLKGFVPYAGQGQHFPHSLEFGYLPLASLMSGPADFNWALMEQLLDSVAARGCQSIFRIYLEYPGKPTGVPQFLLQAGVKMREWPPSKVPPSPPDRTPDYEDPQLWAALKNFIAALGQRYDGDPRIGFITAGLLGTWGEWHCHPHTEWFASRTVQTEVMDAYEAAFKKTPVLLRYPAGGTDSTYAPNVQRSFGYHDDSFAWSTLETGGKDDAWSFLGQLRRAGSAAMDRWHTAPIGGEMRPELWPCLWKQDGCEKGQDFACCIRETHASWLMDSSTSPSLAPDVRARALAAARSLGYELQIVKAEATLTGRSLSLSVTLTNRGIAPFYAPWPVQVWAIGPAGNGPTAEVPFTLKKLLPALSATQSTTLDLAKLPTGPIKLLIGIPHPLKTGKPLRFANANQDPDRPGWLTLGKLDLP